MTTLLKGITRLALNEVLRKSSLKKLWYGRKVKIRIFDFNFEICSKNTKYFLSNTPETKISQIKILKIKFSLRLTKCTFVIFNKVKVSRFAKETLKLSLSLKVQIMTQRKIFT